MLGSDIWNRDYGDMLGLTGLPEGASLVGYADNIVLVITVRNLEEAQKKLDVTLRRILKWLPEHSLPLDTHKSEIVLLTRKRIDTIVPVRIVNVTIETKNVGGSKPSRRKPLTSVYTRYCCMARRCQRKS